MTTTLYGIPNCDTVRRARAWMSEHKLPYDFHDVRKQGLTQASVAAWLEQLDWETLVNRKGTTWRQLPEASRAAVDGKPAALALMLAFPAVIKRPVLEGAGMLAVGFSDAQYQQLFQQQLTDPVSAP